MKISNSLLKNLALGLSLGAISSCSLATDQQEDFTHNEDCVEGCTLEHNEEEGKCELYCLACGRG